MRACYTILIRNTGERITVRILEACQKKGDNDHYEIIWNMPQMQYRPAAALRCRRMQLYM